MQDMILQAGLIPIPIDHWPLLLKFYASPY